LRLISSEISERNEYNEPMKRSKYLNGERAKPDIANLLGKYIKTENGIFYAIPDSTLASDGTIATRKRLAWPSDSLMKAPCAWMPAMTHWIELENGQVLDMDPKERRLNPADKVAWALNIHDSEGPNVSNNGPY
jgi:hypothetical protein